MLYFCFKCIAKFVVFPDLELTSLKQILQVAETKMPPNRQLKSWQWTVELH